MGTRGAVDLAAVAGTSGLGSWVAPPTHLHSFTPILLAARPVLLSSPHAQVWKACFQIEGWRHSWSFEVNFTEKLKANSAVPVKLHFLTNW